MAQFLLRPLHLLIPALSALTVAAYVQPESAVVADASALERAPLASYNYAPAAAEAPEAPQAAYGGWPDRRRQRRNAMRSRRRRMDNPRYYQPNAEYGSDAQVAWENYRQRAYEKRDTAAEIQRQDNYQAYGAPQEVDTSGLRYKSGDNRRDTQAQQEYAPQGYDYRGAYRRPNYKQRREAAGAPVQAVALPIPSQKRRGNWGAWPSDYMQPQQSGYSPPDYDYGDERAQREEPTAAPDNYANDVAGQEGVVEQAGQSGQAYKKK